MAREMYRKIQGWDATLERCPFCGSKAELWECEPTPNYFQKVVMCSNDGGHEEYEGERLECPMYMPSGGFYKATKIDARNVWNQRKAS